MSTDDGLTPEQYAEWMRKAGLRELRQLLYWRWDPIGVAEHFPITEGEYDAYAPALLSLLRKGADAQAIAEHLLNIEREQMGLDSPMYDGVSRVPRVAELILEWRDESIALWGERTND